MRARIRHIGIAVVSLGVLLVGAALLFGPALGAFNRVFRMPAVVRAPFVEAVSDSPDLANAQRQRLLEAWRAGRSYGLHRVVKTVEATPVGLWLVTSGGTLTLITDYTRDPYSNRSIQVAEPAAVELGVLAPEERHPLRAWFPDSGQTYLRCRFTGGHVEFF